LTSAWDDARVRAARQWTAATAVLVLTAACSDGDPSATGGTPTAVPSAAGATTAPQPPGTDATAGPSTSAAQAPETTAGPTSTSGPTTTGAAAPTAPPVPSAPPVTATPTFTVEAFPVPRGSRPHDVSPALDGGVWFTAQGSGDLGLLDPATGETRLIDLGAGSAPHGVITAPDGAAWITDGGRNSIIRFDPATEQLTEHPLPREAAGANLNTAVLDADGTLWFTGQAGWYGRVSPDGAVDVWPAPRGRGPYGIARTPGGEIYYASLAGSHIARIDRTTGEATVLEPPVAGQGSRRVWSDSRGVVWVSGWNSGDLFAHDPATGEWRTWQLPGPSPRPYAVYVDETDAVWLSDFGANAMVRFDPATETFTSVPLPSPDAAVRQIHGRSGEVWGAESSADQLVVLRRV
jgi:virginiamycin B lyase